MTLLHVLFRQIPFSTSCSGVGCSQWCEICQDIMNHADSGFLLSQRNSHRSSYRTSSSLEVGGDSDFRGTCLSFQRLLWLTGRTDVFEGGGSSHAKSFLQLPDQLPGIESITQVNKPRRTVDHWETHKWLRNIIESLLRHYLFCILQELPWKMLKTFLIETRHNRTRTVHVVARVYLWGAMLSAGCIAEPAPGGDSCHNEGKAGKPQRCTVYESSQKWLRRTVRCVWKPERKLIDRKFGFITTMKKWS